MRFDSWRFWEKRRSIDQSKPDSQTEFHEKLERQQLVLLRYIAAALVVAILVVAGAKLVYHSFSGSSNNSTAIKPQAEGTKPPKAPPASTNKNTATDTGNSQSSTKKSASLPNSGPGDVVALFMGTSLSAAVLHAIVSRRKQDKYI